MKFTNYSLTIAAGLLLSGTAVLLSAAEPSATIKIESVEAKTEALPGSKRLWTKLICHFSSTEKWSDGISFNWSVLVRPSDAASKPRVLTGGLTYTNVPQGQSLAILYLSPNATARFGQPIAVKVEAFRGDRQIDTYSWQQSGAPVPADWDQSSALFSGVLLNVRSTPWIIADSDKSPDLLAY